MKIGIDKEEVEKDEELKIVDEFTGVWKNEIEEQNMKKETASMQAQKKTD